MTTNRFPGIGYTTNGRDFNFFEKATITASAFGGNSDGYQQPDMIILFPTQGIIIANEDTSAVVEISFNGNTVHEEINPVISKFFTYDNRVVSKIWFRMKSGTSAVVSVRAWGTR